MFLLGLFFIWMAPVSAEALDTLRVESTLVLDEQGGGKQITRIIYPLEYWQKQTADRSLTEEYLENMAGLYRQGLQNWGFGFERVQVQKDEAERTLIFLVDYTAYARSGEYWQAAEYKDLWFMPMSIELSGGKGACEMRDYNFQVEDNKVLIRFENPEFAIGATTIVQQTINLPARATGISFNDDENGCFAMYYLPPKETTPKATGTEPTAGLPGEGEGFWQHSQLIRYGLLAVGLAILLFGLSTTWRKSKNLPRGK